MNNEYVQISLKTYNRYVEMENKKSQNRKERRLLKEKEARLKTNINNYQKKIEELENTYNKIQQHINDNPEWFTVRQIKNMGYLADINAQSIYNKLETWSNNNAINVISLSNIRGNNVKHYHKDSFKACYNIDIIERVK